MWGFFKLIMPFIDPHTREKLKFNEDMRQYVPESQLLDDFKGSVHLDYEHGVYWPALWEAASQRRAERYRRWEEGGRHIGEFEDYLAGGLAEGVAATLGKAAEEKAKPVETTPAATEPAPAPAAAETKVEEVPKTAALVVETAVDAVAEDAAKLKLAEGAKA